MRGISFHINDEEEVRRDKIDMTNRDIFFLGIKAAEKKKTQAPDPGPAEPQDNIVEEE